MKKNMTEENSKKDEEERKAGLEGIVEQIKKARDIKENNERGVWGEM